MNRSIKFRAWDKKMQCIKEVVEINFKLKQVTLKNEKKMLEDVILSQYTGILDKHGKEIYEKDYIKNIKTDKIYKVTWNGSHAAFEICDIENQYKSMFFVNSTLGDYEIVGNIYENAEFL